MRTTFNYQITASLYREQGSDKSGGSLELQSKRSFFLPHINVVMEEHPIMGLMRLTKAGPVKFRLTL